MICSQSCPPLTASLLSAACAFGSSDSFVMTWSWPGRDAGTPHGAGMHACATERQRHSHDDVGARELRGSSKEAVHRRHHNRLPRVARQCFRARDGVAGYLLLALVVVVDVVRLDGVAQECLAHVRLPKQQNLCRWQRQPRPQGGNCLDV